MTSFLSKFKFRATPPLAVIAEAGCWITTPQGILAVIPRQYFNGDHEEVVVSRKTGKTAGVIEPALPAQQITCVTAVAEDCAELQEFLEAMHERVAVKARRFNLWPHRSPMPPHELSRRDLEVYPTDRYLNIAKEIRALEKKDQDILRLCWVAGLRLHIGVSNWQEAVKLYRGLIRFLPLLAAISVRDPRRLYECYQTLVKLLGGVFMPPRIYSSELIEMLAVQQGFIQDPSRCRWIMQFNQCGTVEVLLFDAQAKARHTAELAAVLRVQSHEILCREEVIEDPEDSVNSGLALALYDPGCSSLKERLENWLQGLITHARLAGMEVELGYIVSLMRRKKLDLGPAAKLVA